MSQKAELIYNAPMLNKRYVFKIKFGVGLFWAVFFVLFCALGVWQLHRYAYKKALLTTYQQRLLGPAKSLQQLTGSIDGDQFQAVMAKGRYINELTILVQNRLYKDQLGFEVLTPFKMSGSKRLILVDRGWITVANSKKIEPARNQHVMGYIKLINEYQFILGDNILNPGVWPLVVQKIDLTKISELAHQAFYPFVVRLNANQAGGFVRDWTISTVLPERHLAYAVQWFVMALVLLIAYFCFCCERVKHDNEK